jgi:hypothetical protein
MKVLVKTEGMRGAAAHIATPDGRPLCKTNINLSTWQVQERSPQGIIICRRCWHMQRRDSASK